MLVSLTEQLLALGHRVGVVTERRTNGSPAAQASNRMQTVSARMNGPQQVVGRGEAPTSTWHFPQRLKVR